MAIRWSAALGLAGARSLSRRRDLVLDQMGKAAVPFSRAKPYRNRNRNRRTSAVSLMFLLGVGVAQDRSPAAPVRRG